MNRKGRTWVSKSEQGIIEDLYIDGYSASEIARKLNRSIGTINNRIKQAVDRTNKEMQAKANANNFELNKTMVDVIVNSSLTKNDKLKLLDAIL